MLKDVEPSLVSSLLSAPFRDRTIASVRHGWYWPMIGANAADRHVFQLVYISAPPFLVPLGRNEHCMYYTTCSVLRLLVPRTVHFTLGASFTSLQAPVSGAVDLHRHTSIVGL